MMKLLFSLTVLFGIYWTAYSLPTTSEKQVTSQDINQYSPCTPGDMPYYPPGRPSWCEPCYHGYCSPCYSHKEKRSSDEVTFYPPGRPGWCQPCYYGYCPPCYPPHEEKNNQKQD